MLKGVLLLLCLPKFIKRYNCYVLINYGYALNNLYYITNNNRYNCKQIMIINLEVLALQSFLLSHFFIYYLYFPIYWYNIFSFAYIYFLCKI